jgi:CRP-like cAMP-binding protein
MSLAESPTRPPPDSRPKNRLLANLPAADFDRIRPHLRTVPVRPRQIFHAAFERIEDVVFLNGGVGSVTSAMQDGRMVEVATVGDEGMLGMEAFFGAQVSTVETMLQVPNGSAEFLNVAAFNAEVARHGALWESVRAYSQAFVSLVMRSTSCMALHPVQERCCRWLLLVHDRVKRDEFDLSQEFIAMMLGSTRPTVNIIASTLQEAGVIKYKHAHVTVLDRKGLEAGSCECYAAIKPSFDALGS